jgi:hypothetical protein
MMNLLHKLILGISTTSLIIGCGNGAGFQSESETKKQQNKEALKSNQNAESAGGNGEYDSGVANGNQAGWDSGQTGNNGQNKDSNDDRNGNHSYVSDVARGANSTIAGSAQNGVGLNSEGAGDGNEVGADGAGVSPGADAAAEGLDKNNLVFYDDEAEQIYPDGTEYATMETFSCGSSNWVIIEDNAPQGGSVGPEDRQWFVEDSQVYEIGRIENGGTLLTTVADFLGQDPCL